MVTQIAYVEGRQLSMETRDKAEAVKDYLIVKEGIKYAMPLYWESPEQTLQEGKGHCGMKCEVLVAMLRKRGFLTRYVIGHQLGKGSTWAVRLAVCLGFTICDAHTWVETFIDGEWLTLDPSPDSSIAHCLGDTRPGTHLCNPRQITRWDEIPAIYREFYNTRVYAPLRFIANVELSIRRFMLVISRILRSKIV